MEQGIKLNWSEFVLMETLGNSKSEASCSGVYIWGFKDSNNNFIPHYVGKANINTTIYGRICQHIANIRSGYCNIIKEKTDFKIPEDRNKKLEDFLFQPPVIIRKESEKLSYKKKN